MEITILSSQSWTAKFYMRWKGVFGRDLDQFHDICSFRLALFGALSTAVFWIGTALTTLLSMVVSVAVVFFGDPQSMVGLPAHIALVLGICAWTLLIVLLFAYIGTKVCRAIKSKIRSRTASVVSTPSPITVAWRSWRERMCTPIKFVRTRDTP